MLKEKEAVIRRAMILLDAFIVSFSFYFAYLLRLHFHAFQKIDLVSSPRIIGDTIASMGEYLAIYFFLVPLWCVVLYLNGMYRSLRTRMIHEIAWIIIKSSFFVILIFSTVVFLFRLIFVSRVFFAIFFVASIIFLLIEKVTIYSVMHYARKRGYNYRSLLIVGTGKRAAGFIKRIKDHSEWGWRIVGVIDDEPGRGIEKVNGVNVIGSLDDIPKILHSQAVDEVVFVVPRSRLNYMENAIYSCEIEGVSAVIAADLFDVKIARSRPTEIDGIPLIIFETTVAEEWQLFIKRSMDIVLSGIGIILLSPLLFVVAIFIRLTSSGPVLFKQRRLGLNGRKFMLYKFRTMYEGAQKELAGVDVFRDMDNPSFKKKKIKYITPVGRILRKFSIDEIPQLFNVFAGHMSLIGPRPSVPEEVKQYKPWQRRRLSMRPGITCLWQVSGRNKLGFEEWVKMDLEYLDNWSLWLDFKILVKTIPVVIGGIGAY